MASHRAQRFRTKHNKEGIGKAGKGDAKKAGKTQRNGKLPGLFAWISLAPVATRLSLKLGTRRL